MLRPVKAGIECRKSRWWRWITPYYARKWKGYLLVPLPSEISNVRNDNKRGIDITLKKLT